MYPPWVKLVVPLAVAAILFGLGWKVSSWRSSGKLERATAAQAAAEKEAREAVVFRAACIEDLEKVAADLAAMDLQRAAAEASYQEAIARPPAVVVEYEERWHTIREVVRSEECHVALGELYDWIHTLPAYATAGGAL